MCRNSQTGCHHLSPQLSSAVHHGQQQQRDLWGTRFSPLQCSGEVAGSLERRGSPREFPGYTAAFSGHKPTSLTQRGYGHTAGVLLSAAVTLMHRWVPQMYARCMQKFLFFFLWWKARFRKREKKKFYSQDALIADNWKKAGSYSFKMRLWNQIDKMGNCVNKHEKSKVLSAGLTEDIS